MKTWNELSIKDKNDIIRVAVQNGITALPDIRERYNEFAEGGPEEVLERVNSSNADFVQRLKDPNRATIQDWSNPDYVATHKLSVGTDEQGNNYIYPEVQNIDGRLVDFTRPPYSPWIGMAAAEERGDTVRVDNLDDAIRFTETYKQYYPSFNYSSGGKIHIKPSKKGTFTAAASRHGMGVQEFASKVLAHKENYSPAMVKKANFARNSSKWHGDGGRLFDEGGEQSSVLAESRENDINWIDNWLHSRVPQMTSNLDAYYNPMYEDVSKKGFGYSSDVKGMNATDPHSLLPPLMFPILSVGAKHPELYKYIPFAEKNKQNVAERIVDSQVAALRNNTKVVDLRDPAIFETLNGNDPYALDFLTRHNKNKMLTSNGSMYGAGTLGGTNTIVVSPFTNNADTFLHEAVHSATHQYPIQNSAIVKILDENKGNLYQPNVPYDDKMINYLKTPTEVYSRLMEFRRHNNLDSHYKVTKEDLDKWRKDPTIDNKKLLDLFSDDVLLQLFNDVAHNNTLQDFRKQFANQAALGGRLFDEGGKTEEEYYPIWLDGVTVKPSGNRPTTRDDWSWANWRELQNEREQQAAESVRRGIDRNGTPIAAGIYGLMAAPFAIEGLGSSAVANSIRTGLQAMNTAFTPSTWLNPVTGAKLLSPTVGTIADAGIQGAFTYEGLNGLWNQGRQGTLLSDPASTFMHGLEVLPLVGLGSKAVGMGVDAWNRSGMKTLWDISRNDAPTVISSSITPKVRTRVGDVEIDNPTLLYHLDRGNGIGAFSSKGAYVKDGFLMPGISDDVSAVPYSWWNKGKPYANTVNGEPLTRLMTSTEEAPGMLHVRSQNYPIGQWTGRRGFVTNAEYVNPEGVEVSNSTYLWEPGYGWRKNRPKAGMTPENTMSAYGFRDYMSNAEFRDAYNAFAKKYGYDEMPVGLSREKMNQMAQKAIADHNTFYRGVVYEGAAPEDIESVAQILGHEPTEEEFLRYAATHPRPNENAIFVSPSPNLASMYGKTARVERPYTLGDNRMNWFNEGEYTIGGNNSGADLINPWISKYNTNAAPTELLLPEGVFRGWVDSTPKPINPDNGLIAAIDDTFRDTGFKFDESWFRNLSEKQLRGEFDDVIRNPSTANNNIEDTWRIAKLNVDPNKRFMFIEPGKIANYDLSKMSVQEVIDTFGPEAEYYKKLYDAAKAHNFEGKYAQIGQDAERNILGRFAVNKNDPDVAEGIRQAAELYSIPEYRARFNRWGTLGDTFVEDALARLNNLKIQGRSKNIKIVGQHGVAGGAYTTPHPSSPTIGFYNTDNSKNLIDFVRHEAHHASHGTKYQPEWMRVHNEKIRPVLREGKDASSNIGKYYDEMDEIVERSKTAVGYANQIRKEGESLDDALTRLADMADADIYDASIPADIRQMISIFTKESTLNFWKNFVGGFAIPATVGGAAGYGYLNQDEGPLVGMAMGGRLYDKGGYTVNRGDSLWKIAHDNNMPLSRLRELNPQVKGNMIHPGDVLRLSPELERQIVNLREERQMEDAANMDNFTAIQAAPHDSNYVVVDKPNKKLRVYDRDNNLVYESDGVSFGKSGNDYNTITYVNANGSIRNNAGNNSTPAGISVITGVGTYHGLPSFTRGRINDDGTVENIASSIHYGNTQKKNMSNGCVRANSDTLKELAKYVGEGTAVYTLPEQKGSKFSVKNNKLNYTADNPFGLSEGPQRYWDDYNVRKDKSYAPLAIVYNGNNYDDEYNANVLSYTNALSINKEALQKKFNLSSDEYNRLAELAVGIAEQESKFGTSARYKLKQQVPDEAILLAKNFENSDPTNMFYAAGEAISKTIKGSTAPARSRGITQIKIGGDNKEMQDIYKELGIDENTINNPYTSALATLSRLAYMYNSEVKGRNFKGADDTEVSPYDALLYKYMGRGSELKNKTATPDKNNYISNVKKYASDFDFFEERLVEKR